MTSPKTQGYDFANQLLASKDFFTRSTRVLDESDSGFRPQEGMMTVAQQVAHTAQTLDWFIEGASRPEGFDLDFEKHAKALDAVTSLAAARQMLDTAFANAIQFLRSRSPEDLSRPLPNGPVMGGQPVSDIAWAMVEHTAHHRGALTVYSRQLGKVPVMPYSG
uniref:DinB-like domain-containing protein n=1 Tax=Solibacter usitatus (strain Ellin6076) TaxID=234267 RepID=Q021V5_SOLUE